jgi:hypothetical protein
VKENSTSILFTVQKKYEENSLKWLKWQKMPLRVKKITPQSEKMTKNDKKITYKFYISVTSSSYPGFIYLRASRRI